MNTPLPDRTPINAGKRYRYVGYPGGFRIRAVMLPGHLEYDGGLPGVSVEFIQPVMLLPGFYPCRTEAEFWQDSRFNNAENWQ